MTWDPDANLPSGPLTPPERQQTRRVIKWYERRVFFRASLRVWAMWLAGLPTAMLALYGLVQVFLHGK